MRNTYYLKEVPREMQNLINLRHFYFDENVKFPAGIFRGLTNLRTLSPCYKVGKETGQGIEELGGSNQLKGKLTIHNLENVRDENQAKNAKLEEKKNVLELSFVWEESRGDVPEGCSNVNDENVLASLQPNAKLESLRIENYMGNKFPSWMMRNPLPLYNLKKLLLIGCLKCDGLPILGILPELRHVEITRMYNLKQLGSEFYGYDHVHEAALTTGGMFPALKTLIIADCRELAEWMEARHGIPPRKVVVFPCLEKLTIRRCPALESVPIDHVMISLRELEISKCERLSSIGLLDHCTSLQVLEIELCRSLTSIPISQGIPSLRELRIKGCDGLSSLPSGIEHCTSLQELEIMHCSSLATISVTRVITSLRILLVEACQNVSSLPVLEYCSSLQRLDVYSFPKLASISLSTDCLQELSLVDCNGLQSLPDFRKFTSLRELTIEKCGGVENLVCGFHIPAFLERLSIYDFHNLDSLPNLEEFTSLRELGLCHIEKLISLPTGLLCLTRLEYLELGHFWEKLDSFPDFKVLSKQLVDLTLHGWPKLSSLPQQVQHFTSLTSLRIECFNGLEALPDWLGNLAFLGGLHIWDCENLKYLPSLEAMERLIKLEYLSIRGCPLLKERCTKDTGEEWLKISHIDCKHIRA